MNRVLSTFALLASSALVGCSSQSAMTPAEGSVKTETRSVCDVAMKWGYVQPDASVPAKAQALLGLWQGEVRFPGDTATMCIAVAVQDVQKDGKTNSQFVWNLGDNSVSTNVVGRGYANWWAQTQVVLPEKGEQVVFAAVQPYRGLWYRYVLDFPTAGRPDVLEGTLIASTNGDATDPSAAKWTGERHTWRVKMNRVKDSYVPFSVATLN